MRRVRQAVPYDECKRRVLVYMASRDRRELQKASRIALEIWPDATFLTGQGAGAAASRILKRMEKEVLVCWHRDYHDWGYKLTDTGRHVQAMGTAR